MREGHTFDSGGWPSPGPRPAPGAWSRCCSRCAGSPGSPAAA